MPTSTATIGTIHTSETLKRRVLIAGWPGGKKEHGNLGGPGMPYLIGSLQGL